MEGITKPIHRAQPRSYPDDRAQVLRYLAWSPAAVRGGLVDQGTGLIYRFDESRRRQWLSVLGVFAAAGLATALLVAVCYFGPGNVPESSLATAGPWPGPEDVPALLGAWVAVLAGVVVHIAVGAAKRAREQPDTPPIVSVRDLLPWTNARFGHVVLKLLLALVGLGGLLVAQGVDGADPLTAFFIGYGLDSVVGLFDAGLERRSAAETKVLGQQLGFGEIR